MTKSDHDEASHPSTDLGRVGDAVSTRRSERPKVNTTEQL